MTKSSFWLRTLLAAMLSLSFALLSVSAVSASEPTGLQTKGTAAGPAAASTERSPSSGPSNNGATLNGGATKIDGSGDYTLGTGDKIRVIVFGEDDLGGEFIVDDTGLVQLPLLGQIQAIGLTVHQFEDGIAAKLLKLGYLTNPHVSVEVENYRPFYILGEVNKPGEYPYVTGMNLLNAIALAGGYTYRADESVIYIRRNGASQEEKYPANETTKIDPGDILRVAERFF